MDAHMINMAMTNNDIPNYEAAKPIADVPETMDPNRMPQFNEDNIGCHCDCACCRGAAEGGGGAIEHAAAEIEHTKECNTDGYESDTSSQYGDRPVVGDQGAEDHLVEVADFGFVSMQEISRALAWREHCTCHQGALPSSDDYLCTPAGSFMASPSDSMIVETSSDEPSMSSSQALSIPSHGSAVFNFAYGGDFGQEALMQRFPLIYNPLRLTADTGFDYPLELSISRSDSRGDFDIW